MTLHESTVGILIAGTATIQRNVSSKQAGRFKGRLNPPSYKRVGDQMEHLGKVTTPWPRCSSEGTCEPLHNPIDPCNTQPLFALRSGLEHLLVQEV